LITVRGDFDQSAHGATGAWHRACAAREASRPENRVKLFDELPVAPYGMLPGVVYTRPVPAPAQKEKAGRKKGRTPQTGNAFALFFHTNAASHQKLLQDLRKFGYRNLDTLWM